MRSIGGAIAFAVVVAVVAGPALAQDDRVGRNDFGGFRNILPAGQGEAVNAVELGAFVGGGQRPETFLSQLPQYRDLIKQPSITNGDLDIWFKPAGFGVSTPEVDSIVTPRPGVTIVRDKTFRVPHVYGETRADVSFGAGYASGEDRMFQMDVLRHLGRARLSELAGPGANDANVRMDAAQLKLADYTEEELQRMIDDGAREAGAEGEQIKQDLLAYVDGINAFLAAARRDASLMPGEYAALGQEPEDWKPTDTVAVASLIGGQFSVGGGGETNAAAVLSAAQARFGERRGLRVFNDFRTFDDPEAPVTVKRRFPFDNPGRPSARAMAMPDPGSVKVRDPVVSGAPPTVTQSSAAASLAPDLSGVHSNSVLVTASRSHSGHPLAVMGPQVGYYSPQILMELDLHGPGFETRGAAFPGISLYVLLGRGQDYAWSATTATADHIDEFAEKLCEPDGSRPTLQSMHYVYRDRCVPFVVREHVIQTTTPPSSPTTAARTIVMRVERSVHGPIQSRATVGGEPVAIARGRSTYFHELESALAFKRLNSGEVTDARSFLQTMSTINFSFNWFYADDRDIAFLQSGHYPRRAKGVDPSFPAWGTGEYDWRGFNPDTYRSQVMPFRSLPKTINPSQGYIVNWNNKQAAGWRASDTNWVYGSVHRSQRLEKRVQAGLRNGGKLDLAGLAHAMYDAATVDLRGQEIYPWIRRVIGRVDDADVAESLRVLDSWVAGGAHRRDMDGDNIYDESAAVLLMDAWWAPMVRRMFEPVLGVPLVERLRAVAGFDQPPGPGGSAYFTGWWGYVDKDLRALLGKRVRRPLSRRYCGRGSRADCRDLVIATLRDARDRVAGQQGADMSAWKKPATCPIRTPPECDQIAFTTMGAVTTPPIPWQDRPTFQQAVEVQGHRPR